MLRLYVKDVRNLVSANMSLDKLGKLFNIKVSKLCFPYNQAKSITILKQLDSLKPHDDEFWKDTFSNKQTCLNDRVEAQNLFNKMNFNDMYQYSVFYLIHDCVLLHSVVTTLFTNFLNNNINLFIHKNFSQSSLSYEQFFIIEPSKQINNILAPTNIKNSYINHFIKKGTTGGLCTSFVHGKISPDTIINEHLKYLNAPDVNQLIWPNLTNQMAWKTQFNKKANGISTIDIRSLYPSAALKKIPVGIPLLFLDSLLKILKKLKTRVLKHMM